MKDLLASGLLTGEDGAEKKIRIDDITSALLTKFNDMDQNEVTTNFNAFIRAWLDSGSVPVENWKHVVRRAIPELENIITDSPIMPVLLVKGLIVPLLKQDNLKMSDLIWYKEEEKDELFDLRGQCQVAACILDLLATDGDKTKEKLASDFKTAHGAAFAHMKSVMESNDAEDFVENWMPDNISEANRDFIISALGLQ